MTPEPGAKLRHGKDLLFCEEQDQLRFKSPVPSMVKSSFSSSSRDDLGKLVELSEMLTIGRASDADLQLADGTVSRCHVLIEWSDRTGYVLRDTGSRIGKSGFGEPASNLEEVFISTAMSF